MDKKMMIFEYLLKNENNYSKIFAEMIKNNLIIY